MFERGSGIYDLYFDRDCCAGNKMRRKDRRYNIRLLQ